MGCSSRTRGNDRPRSREPGDERTPARAECEERVIVGSPSACLRDGLGPMVGKSMAGRAWYNIAQSILLMIRYITRRAFIRALDARI